jgi:ABC-type ATPase involved in cell division
MIHFYHVTKRFDRYSTALQDVTFHIEKGEFVFLTGPSGAGKSTLLKLVLRQITPTEGQIVVNGRNLNAMKRSQLPSSAARSACLPGFQAHRAHDRVREPLVHPHGPHRPRKSTSSVCIRRGNVNLHHLNAYPPHLSGGDSNASRRTRADQ